MSFRTWLLACSASSALLGLSNSANAQSATPTDGSVGAAEGGGPRLEEIVVTAQRREENLQDVPIAITAVTAAEAQKMGVSGTETLTIATPGLTYSRNTGNGATPFLRGVGTAQAVAGTESPVAVYLDDVYVGATSANIFSFNNIESVAVLKGPQGTLFGRNATGGVIQVRTKTPSQSPEFDASVGYGRFDTTEGSAYFNTPISETLAINIAATGKDQGEGFGRSFTTGEDIYKEWNYGVQGGALWQPSSDTSVLLRGDYYEFDSDLGLNTVIPEGAISSLGAGNSGKYVSQVTPPNTGGGSNEGVSLKLDHNSDWARFVSISAYRVAKLHFEVDQDSSIPPLVLATINQSTKNFSQEFQVLSPDSSRLKWIAGLFYFRSRAMYEPFTISGLSQAPRQFTELLDHQTLNSIAGFGEVKYDVLPDTNLTIGTRYTRDKYSLEGARYDDLGVLIPGQTFRQSSENPKWTYRAILDHKFTDEVLVYASYSRGFKSGGFNLTTPNLPAVEPEVLDAYEVGLKSELFDRILRFNASIYHYEYDNLQVTSVGTGQAITINAAAARMNGVDVDLTFQPTDHFSLSGGFAFIDSEFTSFPNGPVNVPRPAVCTPVPTTTGARTGGNLVCAADLSGNRTVQTPKFSGSITAAYTLPTEMGEFALSTTLYHSAKFYWEPGNRTTQPSYNLLNGALSWMSPSGHYEARLWGKNLLDEYYFAFGTESATRDAVTPAMPRSYGVTFGVHF